MIKRTIPEWVTVARVSRGTGHLFLEGRSDANLLAQAFGYPDNVDFRTADEVDVEGDDGSSLWGGFKLRLIKLGVEAASMQVPNLVCLIDADFSIFVTLMCRKENIVQTEYANIPVFTLSFVWLRAFLIKAYGFKLDDLYWEFMCTTLKFAFLSRYLMACSNPPSGAPALSEFVAVKERKPVFDKNGYVRRYFKVNESEVDELTRRIDEAVDWAEAEVRHLSNSNDVFELIYALLRRSGRIGGAVPKETVRQAYFGALDERIVEQEGFRALREWIASY